MEYNAPPFVNPTKHQLFRDDAPIQLALDKASSVIIFQYYTTYRVVQLICLR